MYHFIGLGGIGLSALARVLMQRGARVQGSDSADSSLLSEICHEGAQVYVGHRASQVHGSTHVVYSTSVLEDNEEMREAKRLKLPLLHRSELLSQLGAGKQSLCVTGTHGKTTTSSLLAWTLAKASCDPTFALGGIVLEWNTNGKAGAGKFFVAELDESDGSFLKAAPFGAIVTNLDEDHMDYWQSLQRLEEAFGQFAQKIQDTNLLFWCADDPRLAKNFENRGISYGFSQTAALKISAFEEGEGKLFFDCAFQGKYYPSIEVSLSGSHNALNSAAVFGLGIQLGIEEQFLRSGLKTFPGVKRRMEFKGEERKVQVFDDYGHHPVEIKATLAALRTRAKERRLVVVFQPHRYTRLLHLFFAFAESFDRADCLILTDVYGAGEAPIEGCFAKNLFEFMQKRWGNKMHLASRPHLEETVLSILQPLDTLLTLGAGDITLLGPVILQKWALAQKKMRVAVLFGGDSSEREVSCMSAQNLLKGLDSSVYDVISFSLSKEGFSYAGLQDLMACAVAIPVFHGPRGEDGMIQGFLETLRIPYAGCDYGSSALCMHKGWTKRVAQSYGIPTAPFLEIKREKFQKAPEKILAEIESLFSYPVWIKPIHLGSSIGVGRAEGRDDVSAKAEVAFALDDSILVEKHIEGRQIEFGLLGHDFIRVGPPCEILSGGAFVDYASKYGAQAMPYAIPARLSEAERGVGIELAKKVYEVLGCQGLARVDFFIDARGCFWLNEVNPFPGLTDTSAFPKLWENDRVSMGEMCDALIIYALYRARHR